MQRRTKDQKSRRIWWRPIAWATAALMAAGLAAAFATAASAQPGPAAGVAPGAVAVGNIGYVFYTAGDGSVWQKQVGSTNAATSVGGRLVSAPSPVNDTGTGTILVFGQGTDNALWATGCTPGGGCGPWTSLGGVLTSKPGAVQTGTAATDQSVYVRGSDGTMWARDNTPTGWGPWHFVGGRLLSGTGPSAAFKGTSQYVLAVGTDQHLYLLKVGGPGFSPVGGTTTASPAITSNGASPLQGYATGTDSAGWKQNLTALSGWKSIGGFLTSGFGAATITNGQSYGYALGGNGQVYQFPSFTNTPTWSQVTP